MDQLRGRTWRVVHADCREALRALPEESVHACVTSPPYFGLRDYGTPPVVFGGDATHEHAWGEELPPAKEGPHNTEASFLAASGLTNPGYHNEKRKFHLPKSAGAFCACGAWRGHFGLEPTPQLYVEHLVDIFREVHRVLRDDGVLWLNLGDSYAGSGRGGYTGKSTLDGSRFGPELSRAARAVQGAARVPGGWKEKDLLGIPWRAAFALQEDGWYLRSGVIWEKVVAMPESVFDRPTVSHEYVFLLTKKGRYFYDADAIREPLSEETRVALRRPVAVDHGYKHEAGERVSSNARNANRLWSDPAARARMELGRNARTVWRIAPEPYQGAHFAVMPTELARRCILSGCPQDVCSECGLAWERRFGRPCPACGAGIARQMKSCGACGFRDRDWRKKRTATAELVADPDGHTAGRAVPRREHLETVRVDLGYGPMCRCGRGAERAGGIVVDPFGGSGTTGAVGVRHGRRAYVIDAKDAYCKIARTRISEETPPLIVGQQGRDQEPTPEEQAAAAEATPLLFAS